MLTTGIYIWFDFVGPKLLDLRGNEDEIIEPVCIEETRNNLRWLYYDGPDSVLEIMCFMLDNEGISEMEKGFGVHVTWK